MIRNPLQVCDVCGELDDEARHFEVEDPIGGLRMPDAQFSIRRAVLAATARRYLCLRCQLVEAEVELALARRRAR